MSGKECSSDDNVYVTVYAVNGTMTTKSCDKEPSCEQCMAEEASTHAPQTIFTKFKRDNVNETFFPDISQNELAKLWNKRSTTVGTQFYRVMWKYML